MSFQLVVGARNRKKYSLRGGWGIQPAVPVLIVYLSLTLILTQPLIFNLTTTVPNDIGDPLLNTWILAWDSHALLTDPLHLFDANIFYPLPRTLAYSEHLLSTALLAMPVQLLANEPVLSYNLSLLITFPLAAFGMYLLILRWTGQRGAAFIAGLIFAFTPYRFAAIAHLQLLTFQWLPFALLCLDLLFIDRQAEPSALTQGAAFWSSAKLRTNRTPLAIALTIFLLLQLLASWYLALYTALIIGSYLSVMLIAGQIRLSRLPLLMALFLISLLFMLPFILPYLALIDDLREARPLSLALSLAAAPTDFAAAAPFNRFFGPLTAPFRARPDFTEENTLFLGLLAPFLTLLALLATAKLSLTRNQKSKKPTQTPLPAPRSPLPAPRFPLPAPRFPLPASRSPLPALLTIFIISLLLTFPTPYATLATRFPLATVIRVPARWIIPAIFALSGLAGFGYMFLSLRVRDWELGIRGQELEVGGQGSGSSSWKLGVKFSNVLLVGCTLVLISEALSVPLPLAAVENRSTLNPAYHWLARQPEAIVLVELPLHSAPAPEFPEVKRLYASTLGWWQLANGYSGYTPPRQPELAQHLADFPNQEAISTLQSWAAFDRSSPATSTAATPSPGFYLLVHPGEAPFDRTQWETVERWQAERNPALRPAGQFEGDYLYEIMPPDSQRFTAPPLATFGEQHIRLLAVDNSSLLTGGDQAPSQNGPPASHQRHITLFWQAEVPLSSDYTVFIHLRAADGFVRHQADGPPVAGHYPTTNWQQGEIIQDIHPLPPEDFSQVDHLAIGLYQPVTGERLPAFNAQGQRLADDAVIIDLP